MVNKKTDHVLMVRKLCERLAYVFKNETLLYQALTHRSCGAINNERLEFLGDSVLNLVVTTLLVTHFPKYSEGHLSRMRAVLVKGDTLADIALQLDLGPCIQLGTGEQRAGGQRRKSILADALEAVLGAIYLDGGLEAVLPIIETLFQDRCGTDLEAKMMDHKSSLQEYLQSKKKPLPVYTLMRVAGELNEPVFHVSCTVVGMADEGRGQGLNRRQAEQAAAYQLLHKLKPC